MSKRTLATTATEIVRRAKKGDAAAKAYVAKVLAEPPERRILFERHVARIAGERAK